ncbi:MAG TPA: PA2169 family four-helix-bundle protein [Chitinophagaceae bacterium]|jgi:uncharacterized protein (TIGR02284 family)|nr:PA2169 family four-helix-bundle protein [Chitinophagaceae bacterium]
MATNEKNAEVLNDLIEINNDRLKGYEKAVGETRPEDADLRDLFIEVATVSRDCLGELKKIVSRNGEAPAEGTTQRGKIYRVWMDVKAVITGHNRKAILASCEFGEDAAQRAYQSALDTDGISPDVRELITEQKAKLRKSHDRIKILRDTQSA